MCFVTDTNKQPKDWAEEILIFSPISGPDTSSFTITSKQPLATALAGEAIANQVAYFPQMHTAGSLPDQLKYLLAIWITSQSHFGLLCRNITKKPSKTQVASIAPAIVLI